MSTYILVYVDDFIIIGSDEKEIRKVIRQLDQEFLIKHLGNVSYFLGIEVIRKSETEMLLCQRKYISKILIRAKIDKPNSLSTPMVSNLHLSKTKGEAIKNEKEYRSIVGALQYVVVTRLEIAYSVNRVCQFMQSPLSEHWKAVNHILRYLNGTLNYGILLKSSKSLNIQAFADAD